MINNQQEEIQNIKKNSSALFQKIDLKIPYIEKAYNQQ